MKTTLKLIAQWAVLTALLFGLMQEGAAQNSLHSPADKPDKTNLPALGDFAERSSEKFFHEKQLAREIAASQGWVLRQTDQQGRVIELMRLERGMPVYYTTYNAQGAGFLHSSDLYPGAVAGLNLTGTGQLLGIWDGGGVRASHQEFSTGGTSRVTQKDSPSALSDHSTHVAGTMTATGVTPAARGMAYAASLWAWDWNNDAAEMATAAGQGLRVSNHSYGPMCGFEYGNFLGPVGWYWFGDISISQVEDYWFGFYDQTAHDWDLLARNAPYYLIVKAAGNDRGNGPEPGGLHYYYNGSQWTTSTQVRQKDGGDNGYDCLPLYSSAKNIMTVGAIRVDGQMTSFSGWGPTDDGRIKPDVVAKGEGVYSSVSTSNTAYDTYPGTSMAAPMISGSVGLLLQHQQNLHPGVNLLSSSLKALIIHTANDAISGAPGPDYRFGWGLMNTAKAAGVMTRNSEQGGAHIYEASLASAQTFELEVTASGTEPLRATLVWTDVPGSVSAPALNLNTPKLVNDLDLRIIGPSAQTNYPYVLNPQNPSAAATTGDNIRDNVEMVHLAQPVAGQSYIIRVSHKGSLSGGSQAFSLIVTGNQPESLCQPPASITASLSGENQVVISWTPPSSKSVSECNGQEVTDSLPQHQPQGEKVLSPIFSENFSGVAEGGMPNNWQRTHLNWGVNNTSSAGGEAPELSFNWYPEATGIFGAISPLVNATGYTELELRFLHTIDHYEGSYTLKLQTTTDGQNWTIQWQLQISSSTSGGKEQVSIPLPGLAGQQFYFAFVFDGNSYNINDWFIDNVQVLAGQGGGSLPQLSTTVVTNITASSATSGGTISSDGGSAIAARGLVWSSSPNPDLQNNMGFTQDGSGTGAFVSQMSSLSPQTTYYCRAYASNASGTAYGEQRQFMTLSVPAPTLLGYKIYRNAQLVASVGAESLSYTDGPLESGEYTYGVSAQYTQCESEIITANPVSVQGGSSCEPEWQPVQNLQFNMQLVARIEIDGNPSAFSGHKLGAFVNGQCRGMASPLSYADGLVFLSIASSLSSGENFDLMLWNGESCMECTTGQSFSFNAWTMLGTPDAPIMVSCQEGVELDISFGQGFTWFSINVDTGSMNPDLLFALLTPCTNDRIIGQNQFAVWHQGNWKGTLTEISPLKTYVMHLCQPQSLVLSGAAFAAAPFGLGAGYTWLGYLPSVSLPVNNALQAITPAPAVNDLIISQSAMATWYGGSWTGSLTHMHPGKGYMIKLSHEATLDYPDLLKTNGVYEKIFSGGRQHTMTLVARLDESVLNITGPGNLYIRAMAGEECRGEVLLPDSGDGLIFLSISSDNAIGENIGFLVEPEEGGASLEIHEVFVFESFRALGSIDDPVVLHAAVSTDVPHSDAHALTAFNSPYPNPSARGFHFPFYLHEPSQVSLIIYDYSGRELLLREKDDCTAGNHEWFISAQDLAAGVLLYRWVIAGNSGLKAGGGKLLLNSGK